MNGHEYIDPNIFFFKIKTGKITRGHELTLVKGQSRLDVRKYSFPQRTVKKCNKLSADWVQKIKCLHYSTVSFNHSSYSILYFHSPVWFSFFSGTRWICCHSFQQYGLFATCVLPCILTLLLPFVLFYQHQFIFCCIMIQLFPRCEDHYLTIFCLIHF